MTWNDHLRKAQDALAGNNVSLAEIESALALKDAIAVSNPDENAAAFQTVQSLIHLIDSITKAAVSTSAFIGYQNYDDWDVGYAYAANHFQNQRYQLQQTECETLLCFFPAGVSRDRIFYTKMMLANALVNQGKAHDCLPCFDDKEFRNWLKWNFDPYVRKNLQFASLYWQYLPLLPIPNWLRANPQLAPQIDQSQVHSVSAGSVPSLTGSTSILLWDQINFDHSIPSLPCNSTQERFAHALFEQGTDLEAQAYRIVVTSVDPDVDYVESDEATLASIKAELKNVRNYPRAVERLQLASEKVGSALQMFEALHPRHPRLEYLRKVLVRQCAAMA